MRKMIAVGPLGTAAACGTTTPPPKAPTPDGTMSQQPSDDASRSLTEAECASLGQSIVEACHGTNTRSAQFGGWCGDVAQGVDSGTWIAECQKHMKYMDAVCFTSNPGIRAMMDCD